MINSSITERDSSSGAALTPQFEVNLPTAELQHVLEQVFAGWETLRQTVVHQKYKIPRSGHMALLETDVMTWVVEKGKEKTMDFQDVYNIQDEIEQIQATYQLFNEDTRLNHSKAARVEFLTSIRYIERYLKPGARILDVGAGAGEYSLYFARKGYQVCALELAERNIQAFRRKLTPEDSIELVQGNAVDLGRYESESFDAVLLFGPLYHLHRLEDRKRCIEEAKRVCKKDGKLFFAFISHDMVILTEFSYRPDYFLTGDYDKESFRLEDFPFVFHTVDACRELLRGCGVSILHEVAADGASELLADRINAMDEESYAQYLHYHFYICEKKEFLGMTNHLLFVGEKGNE